MSLKYKRCIIKISGEALKGKDGIYDKEVLHSIARQIKKLNDEGLEIGIVVGGGNIWRGNLASTIGMDKINGDYMGMMATVMNSLALESVFREIGINKVVVCSAIEMNKVAEPYFYKKVIRKLETKHVVILAAGTGYSYFTTDTTATLRAIELKADVILMGKNGVDGIYDADPKIDSNAHRFKEVSMNELIEMKLNVMDLTASTLALDGHINIVVFNLNEPDNIYKSAHGLAKVTKVNC